MEMRGNVIKFGLEAKVKLLIVVMCLSSSYIILSCLITGIK